MHYYIEVTTRVDFDHSVNTQESRIEKISSWMNFPPELDKSAYVMPDGMPTKEGCSSFTAAAVEGLIANMHIGEQQGYISSATHLRQIISKLEEGLVRLAGKAKGDYRP